MADSPAYYRRLPGTARNYQNQETGKILSRRQYDKLFRQPEEVSRGSVLARVKRAVSRMMGNKPESASQAAKAEKTTVAAIKRRDFLTQKPSGHYELERAGRVSYFTTDGTPHANVTFDLENLQTMSAYYHAIDDFRERGRTLALRSFEGVFVEDVAGNRYELVGDPNQLRSLIEQFGPSSIEFFESEGSLISNIAARAA